MKAPLKELPAEYGCRLCGRTKPLAEMLLVYLKAKKIYLLKPRCKDCQNARERGHRRAEKRAYLQRWRKENAALNRSYWDNAERREQARVNAQVRFAAEHDAILIQGRLRRRGMKVSMEEARDLLKKFGPCYPSRYGLTPKGLRECERIRHRMQYLGRKVSCFEIRLMVYADGHFIKPKSQKRPYKHASERLRNWHAGRREQVSAP